MPASPLGPQQPLHRGEQRRLVKAALHDVAVGADIQAAPAVLVASPGGGDDHRQRGERGLFADRLGQPIRPRLKRASSRETVTGRTALASAVTRARSGTITTKA